MNPGLRSLYPALLAAIDIAIGGLLYLRDVSLLGLLMAAVGTLVICHVMFNAANRTNSALYRFASRS